MIRQSAILVLAIGSLGAGCIRWDEPVIHRPRPSLDAIDAAASSAATSQSGPEASAPYGEPQADFAGPGIRGGRPGPAIASAAVPAAAPLAVSTEWRELSGAGGESYEVQPTDTLSEIAMKQLDTMRNVPLLMLANRKLVRPETVWKGDTIVVPGPAFFVSPFVRDGEKADSQQLLRYREEPREGFVGVLLAGERTGRFVAAEVRDGRSRLVFDSTGLLPGAPSGAAEAPWSWRAVDLDNDGGLDLVCSRKLEPGGVLQACVFQNTGRGYRRHVLAEKVLRGDAEGRRVTYRESTLTIRGGESAGGWADVLKYRWVGDRFEVSK